MQVKDIMTSNPACCTLDTRLQDLDEPAADQLASCYRNALRLAEDNGITSIAFPAISTGRSVTPWVRRHGSPSRPSRRCYLTSPV
jgi:hypothetical protein